MNARRWWSIAVTVVIVLLGTLVLVDDEISAPDTWLLIGLLLAIGALYGVVLRRFIPLHFGVDEPEPPPLASISAQVVLIALAAVAVSIDANMMNTMAIVLPLIWMSSPGRAHAVTLNVVAVVALGCGYAANQGWTSGGILTGAWIALVSVAFSIALGLWITSIAEWGTERSRLLADLTAAQGELEAAHRESGASAERERLARDIHDTIAQSLTSIVMLAERASREADPTQTIALLEDTARDALADARGLVAANAAVSSHEDPLEGSLTRLGEHFTRETNVDVTTSVELATPLRRELEVMLLRCVQEGLANVRKHASARSATVRLDGTATEVTLTIADDGSGLGGVTLELARGFGLTGMRQRVQLEGGTLSIQDVEPTGVRLTIVVPLAHADVSGASS